MENINNENIDYSNFYEDQSSYSKKQEKSFKVENVSSITNNKDYSNYIHYLCPKCNMVPKIMILNDFKLKVECKCKESSNKEISISEFKKYLVDKKSFNKENFKCKNHKKKFLLYCKKCEKNLCFYCQREISCIKGEHQLEFNIEPKEFNTIERIKKSVEQMIQRNSLKKMRKEESFNSNNFSDINSGNSIEIIKEDDNDSIIYINKNKNEDKIQDVNELISESEQDESYIEDYLYIFLIILNDYISYPNHHHNENISNFFNFLDNYYFSNNYLILKYKYDGQETIKIFGKKFVINNKDNCYIKINGKFMDLTSHLEIKEIFNHCKNIQLMENFELLLIQIKNKKIIDASNMFYGVSSLISISDKSSFDTSNITNMSYMFYNCSSLNNLSYISNWNTIKVIDMSYMFYNCSSLKVLDNIYYWNTKNVKKKEKMLYGCKENIYFYHVKYISYIMSLFLFIILFFYDLIIKRYLFALLSKFYSLFTFSNIIIQIVSPYYFLYLSFYKYELEKYLDKSQNYSDFMKINKNNELLKDKLYLKHINIYASIFYTPLLITIFASEVSKGFLINRKIFIFLIILFIVYSIFQILNFKLFLRLSNSFQVFEFNLNKSVDLINRSNFGNFNSEMNMIILNIIMILRSFIMFFYNLIDNNKNIIINNKKKNSVKKYYYKNEELFESLTS